MTTGTGRARRYFGELRRRRVFRTVAAYLVVAWLLLQVADVTFAPLGFDERWQFWLIVAAAAGVVPAAVLAWVFDITGKGVANPVATFWTGAMMLEHLGETKAAARLMRAVERVTADPALHTPDLGGPANTRKVTDAVFEAIRADNL